MLDTYGAHVIFGDGEVSVVGMVCMKSSWNQHIFFQLNNSKRPVDALAVKTSITH